MEATERVPHARRPAENRRLEAGAAGTMVIDRRGRPVRLGADAAALHGLLTGPGGLGAEGAIDAAGLATALGSPWTPSLVSRVAKQLGDAGLLEAAEAPSSKRITFRPPLALQLTLMDPSRLLWRVRGLCRALTGRPAAAAAVGVGVAGLVLLAGRGLWAGTAIDSRVPFSALVVVIAALAASTFVHELAHAATLVAAGGRPRRLGVMIFYLSPACFCDVTDAWTLPRRDRVRVALAGPVVHFAMAGGAVVAALATHGTVRAELSFFAEACYAMVGFNLLPLVKLDGYVALATWLDTPFLRNQAMTDARSYVGQVLFGVRRPRKLRRFEWAVPYGLACLFTPFVLVGLVTAGLLGEFEATGRFGAAILAVILVGAGYVTVRGVVRLVRNASRSGASLPRLATGVAAIVVVAAAFVGWTRVPDHVTGGFSRQGGRLTLALGPGESARSLGAGTQVSIGEEGLLSGPSVGAGTIAGAFRHCTVGLPAVLPVSDGAGLKVPALCAPVRTAVSPSKADSFSVRLPASSLSSWIHHEVIDPLINGDQR